MSSPPAHLQPYTFKPGQSGNPGGKPVGARNRLQAKFLNALADDFEQNGKQALEDCRKQDPAAYVRAITALMPKEIEVSRPLADLSDDELESVIATVRALAAAQSLRDGEGAAQGSQPAAGLSPVHQAG